MQNEAMLHLQRHCPSLRTSWLQLTGTGQHMAEVTNSAGQRHFLRLLSFVPGRMFALVQPHSAEVCLLTYFPFPRFLYAWSVC